MDPLSLSAISSVPPSSRTSRSIRSPENDRMTQRYRDEAATLETLIQTDERLAGQCELLRSMVQGKDGIAILAKMADLEAGLEAIRGTLQRREAVLMSRG